MKMTSYFREKPRAGLYLLITAATLLTSGLLAWRTLSTNVTVILVLNYLAKLLVLLIGLSGLGLAYPPARKREWRSVIASFAVTAGAYLFIQAVAAVCTAFAYIEYGFDVTLAIELGTAFTNTLFQLLLHVTVFLFVFLIVFLKRTTDEEPLLFSLRPPLSRANLLSVGVLFLFQLAELIADTVVFIMDYYPNIYPNEIITMIFDFVFLILSMMIGYVALYAIELLLTEEKNA